MPSKKMNKATRLERNQAIATGLRSLQSKTMIPINGQLMKASDAADLFDAATKAEKEVAAARANYRQTVMKARGAEAAIKVVVQPIKSFVQNAFGECSHTSATFGFAPRKSGRVSAEVRCEAVEKLRATRVARGTMGSRQKAKTHGHVDPASN